VPPTVTVVLAFIATNFLTSHPILFASLASSAFLIYRDPQHRMNRVRVMVVAQLLGWSVGSVASLVFGSSYLAGGIAMGCSIILLVALDVLHPPAISTSLGFALIGPHTTLLATFLVALFLVATLAVLQRIAVWAVRRFKGDPVPSDPASVIKHA
jgi:CBS-domain-containing membrane protein